MEIILSRPERLALDKLIKGRKTRAELTRRARLILLMADGFTWEAIAALLDCSSRFIRLWPKRFAAERLAGLYSRQGGGAPLKCTARLEARILAKTRQKPRDGSTHWSTRKLATELGLSHMMVARVWQRAGLAPHRLERYLASDDPHFEKKAADIIGLYLHPPQHAAVFCVD
jgi:transposase